MLVGQIVLKKQAMSYIQITYAKALKSMVSLTEKKEKISTRLAKQYEKTTTAIVDVFWNGSYLMIT